MHTAKYEYGNNDSLTFRKLNQERMQKSGIFETSISAVSLGQGDWGWCGVFKSSYEYCNT